MARYGPRSTEPVGIRVAAAKTIRYLFPHREEDATDLDGFFEILAEDLVPIILDWSENDRVTWLCVEGTVSVDGVLTLNAEVPRALDLYLEQLRRVLEVRPGDVVDLWDGLTAPGDLAYRRADHTSGWIATAAELLMLREAGQRIPVSLPRRLVAALIREPPSVSGDVRLRKLLDLSEPHTALLDRVAPIENGKARVAEAVNLREQFGLPHRFTDALWTVSAGDEWDWWTKGGRDADVMTLRRAEARRILAQRST